MAVKVGVESFSDRTLKGITKNLTAQQEIETIEAMMQIGLKVYAATMTYIVGESEEDRQRTTEILTYLGQKGLRWQRPHCTPLPGTKLFELFKQEGYDMESDFSLYDGGAGKLHHLIEDFNRNHGVQGYDSGRHGTLELAHSGIQVG